MPIYQDDLVRLFPRLKTNKKIPFKNSEGRTENYRKLVTFCESKGIEVDHDVPMSTLWRLYHNDFETKVCRNCGTETSFVTFGCGFRECCSTKCSAISRDNSTRAGFVTREGQDKSRDTMESRYGVRHQMHVSDVIDRQQTKRYKSYAITSPSGVVYVVQGYERFVIQELWDKFGEHDVVCRKKDIPKFWYEDGEGVRRKYYPDFYVKSQNMIIEVKSTYTIKFDKGLTKFKRQAVLDAGYGFELIVYVPS